ncbi:methyltransferase domain-containing protein [Flexivirga sp. ID2601S]|uniref:Methyltransferase domain-containing protein n=1 Tax=Flexivirga aerilata TaxID=1656889 RepID=A0A849AIV7_9MICO|nr:methyltransferase domain-containing protein [Flexivirga aerilata]NNG39486.1 methyltransferase domain-containing protein [Flexivirga aerilata]
MTAAPETAPSAVLLGCPDGLDDLVRGDLRERHGIASERVAPGVVGVDAVPAAEALGPMVERVGLALDPSDPQRALPVLDAAAAAIGMTQPAFRVQSADPDTRSRWIDAIGARGWPNLPADWQLNVDLDTGRVDLGPLHWSRRVARLERLPATTPGPVAAGLLRLAKLRPGDLLLDPCGGVGTVAIVDAVQRGGPAISADSDAESVATARRNVAALGLDDAVEVLEADAAHLPLDDDCVDRVVSDLPFGKRIGSNELNRTLYPAILRDLERVLTADGRCVLLTDDKRVFADAVARARGLKVVGERVIRYNGVTPTAYVVVRSRRRKRR